ncbi:MAG: hypothetical protein J5904_00800 [Anaerovibrio sp.]|nr:hypothetical protein [Anaerovibrio sp.]
MMGKLHKNRRYYVDASMLPVPKRNELFDLFDGWGFFASMDYERPGCFVAYWDWEEEPEDVIDIPLGCIVTPMF